MRLPRTLTALPLAALLAAGCGGTDTGGSAAGGADPAAVIPKDAVVYVEAVVRPEGDQQEQVRELLSKVLRTEDPGARLKELVDEGFKEEGQNQTFDKDIDPWLGERIALGVTNLAAEEPGFIAAVAATDTGEAGDFLASEAKGDGATKRSYEGSTYYVDSEGSASGVVEDFVVLGDTEADFKKAVDTAKGDGLDGVERFDEALEELPEERLGTLYVDPQRFAQAAGASAGDEATAGVIKSALEGVGVVTAYAQATSDTATIESRTVISARGTGADLAKLGSGAAPELLKSLPEDSWAAMGIARLGDGLRTGLESVAGGLGSAVIGGQLREQTGLDLQQDVLSWIGDVAVFVRGDTVSDIGGGLVIQATDEAAAGRALPRLVQAARLAGGLEFQDLQLGGADQAYAATIPGAPGPVVLARAGDRVVMALGDETATAALKPSGTLGDTELYSRAESALDDVDPTMVVDGPTAVKLMAEAAGGDADFAEAKPYLELLDLLAVGASKDGDTLRHRFTARVR